MTNNDTNTLTILPNIQEKLEIAKKVANFILMETGSEKLAIQVYGMIANYTANKLTQVILNDTVKVAENNHN